MSAPLPRIVATLPGRSVDALRRHAGVARSSGADVAEIRVDRLAAPERGHLAELFPAPLPLLLTFRSRDEGGEAAEDERERRDALLALATLPFRWIDLEVDRDLGLAEKLPPPEHLGRIISHHITEGGLDSFERRLRQLEAVEGVGKLVLRAGVAELFGRILPLLDTVQGSEVVVHTTGPSGPILRALARRYRFPFVFAALPEGDGAAVEPSQIPIDRLRPFLDRPTVGPLFAVAGRPVGHSRSPRVHAAWMKEERRPGLYVALEFADDAEFVGMLPPLANAGFRGLNVTQPFKQTALAAATEVAASAADCGAANCLTLAPDAVRADNTDLAAMLRRLGELRADGRWDGRSLTVVGSGGAARATLAAARAAGAAPTIVARRPGAAASLAREFGAGVAPEAPRRATLLVNATEVGRAAGVGFEVPFEGLAGPGTHVLDWVYAPASPVVKIAAERAGATYEDGWRLFVYQAAASYSLWWGSEPSAAALARALEEGGCAG